MLRTHQDDLHITCARNISKCNMQCVSYRDAFLIDVSFRSTALNSLTMFCLLVGTVEYYSYRTFVRHISDTVLCCLCFPCVYSTLALCLGMTNRKDLIDEALLRPGRMEVQVEISKLSSKLSRVNKKCDISLNLV